MGKQGRERNKAGQGHCKEREGKRQGNAVDVDGGVEEKRRREEEEKRSGGVGLMGETARVESRGRPNDNVVQDVLGTQRLEWLSTTSRVEAWRVYLFSGTIPLSVQTLENWSHGLACRPNQI